MIPVLCLVFVKDFYVEVYSQFLSFLCSLPVFYLVPCLLPSLVPMTSIHQHLSLVSPLLTYLF